MSKGLHVFDHALHEGNIWLKAVQGQLHCSEREAYQALRTVLQALRDRLPNDQVINLSAQLPIIIRGIYFEGWQVSQHAHDRRAEELANRVREHLPAAYPLDGKSVVVGVLQVLWERLDPGETAKIMDLLPANLRQLWPESAGRGRSH